MSRNERSSTLEEKELRRSQIIQSAIEEFDDVGFEKATMSNISKRSGLSRTLINFYFKDKKSLHKELEVIALGMLAKLMKKETLKAHHSLEKLKKCALSFVKFHQKHKGLYDCIMRDDEQVEIGPVLKENSLEISDLAIDIIESGLKKGELKNPYPSTREAAMAIWCIAHGHSAISINKKDILKDYWSISPKSILQNVDLVIHALFQIDG